MAIGVVLSFFFEAPHKYKTKTKCRRARNSKMDVEDWGLLLLTKAVAIGDVLSSSSAGHSEEHCLSWVQGDAKALSSEDGSMNVYTVFQQLLTVCFSVYSSSWFSLLTVRNFSFLRAPMRMRRTQDGRGSSGEDAGHRTQELRFTNDGLSGPLADLHTRWHDGTRKYASRSNPDHDHVGLLVEALLDKLNEENNLLGDLTYEIEDVVNPREVYEGQGGWYYHLNFTRKATNGGGIDNLFFAEVLKTRRERLDEFELTCLHMLKSVDNGPCYGCTDDHVGMKHPADVGIYRSGNIPRGHRIAEFFRWVCQRVLMLG